jgi:hypothetical protein
LPYARTSWPLTDRKDGLSFLSLLTAHGIDTRIIDTGKEETSWYNRRISTSSARPVLVGISLSQNLGLFLSIQTCFHLTPAVEFTMSLVIKHSPGREVRQIIRMGIRNEIVLDLVELILIVVILVFIFVDFGFDIEELIAAFATTFSAVTLKICQYIPSGV